MPGNGSDGLNPTSSSGSKKCIVSEFSSGEPRQFLGIVIAVIGKPRGGMSRSGISCCCNCCCCCCYCEQSTCTSSTVKQQHQGLVAIDI